MIIQWSQRSRNNEVRVLISCDTIESLDQVYLEADVVLHVGASQIELFDRVKLISKSWIVQRRSLQVKLEKVSDDDPDDSGPPEKNNFEDILEKIALRLPPPQPQWPRLTRSTAKDHRISYDWNRFELDDEYSDFSREDMGAVLDAMDFDRN